MVDYRKLRFNNLNSPEFKHLWLLSFWPIYGLMFLVLEWGFTREYYPIYCSLDDVIPFCEFFVVPYIFWYVFLFGMHFYTLLFDVKAFKKLIIFIMITFSFTVLIYIIFPNMQELRPTEFQRDNVFVDIMKGLYVIDTNTNVFPSLHVIGSFGVLFASWNCKGFNRPFARVIMTVLTVLISISTVFLKQHSVLDIFGGVIVSFAALPLISLKLKKQK